MTVPAATAARHLAAGIAHARAGDLAAAEDAFTAAVLADHTRAEAWNNRGLVRQMAGRPADALFDFDLALMKRPDYPEARGNRAAARRDAGDLPGADEDLTAAVAGAARAEDKAGWLVDRAAVRLAAGDAAAAAADATAALEAVADHPLALHVRGEAHTALGDLAAAQADLDRAVELAPPARLPKVLHARAAVAVARKRFPVAVADYDRALELDPTFVMAYLSRGHARYHLRDRRALDDYRAAVRLDPAAAAGELTRLARKHAAESPEATLANCQKHVQARPDDALGHLRLGVTLWLLGRAEEARPWLARGCRLAPEPGPVYARVVRAVCGMAA